MRIRKGHFEGLFNEYEARYVYESPQIRKCWIEFGEIYVEESTLFQVNRSLEDPELFLSFARLGAHGNPATRSISEWVRKYGLPTRKEDELSNPHNSHKNERSMYLQRFIEEAINAHQLLSLYADIRGRDLDKIRTKVANPQSSLDNRLKTAFDSSDYRGVKPYFSEDELDLFMSLRVLSEALTQKMDDVRLRLSAESSNTVTQSWQCLDLLSAIYLQFYLLVTDHREMRYCDFCGSPFPLTRSDKRYCDSTCRSRMRHAR